MRDPEHWSDRTEEGKGRDPRWMDHRDARRLLGFMKNAIDYADHVGVAANLVLLDKSWRDIDQGCFILGCRVLFGSTRDRAYLLSSHGADVAMDFQVLDPCGDAVSSLADFPSHAEAVVKA